MSNLVEVKNLNKIYGRGHTQVHALKEVNLSVAKGEFISIMGPSGSGKTTLLNMLGALDKPTNGEIIIGDSEISRISERKLFKVRRGKIGFIFQTFYLVPTLSALDNVLLPVLPLRGIKKQKELRSRAEELLNQVDLGDRLSHKPNQLSGGEQQRVAIARSLILNPPLILADEPTGNLDSNTGSAIFHLMKDLNQKEGKTFIIVTHDPRIAQSTERTLYLKDGQIFDHPTVELENKF